MNIKTKKMVNTAQPILAINSDIYTIPLYVYPTKVFVLSNVTDSVAEAFLNTRGVPKDDAIDFVYREDNEPGLTFFFEGNIYIRLKVYPEHDENHMRGTITHESFHAMNSIMRFICASEPCEENEEPCAYLLEYIFNEICKKVGL